MLETAKLCGEIRKDARGEYWENFANRIGRHTNTHEIWREVNKVRGFCVGFRTIDLRTWMGFPGL